MSAKIDISNILKLGLIKLDMYDKKPVDGLKFVADLETEQNPYIRLHLVDAKKYNATAVYFRHFENRPSIPQIYIYEEQKDINSLHKRLWSSCKVPMFFIFLENEIKIYNNMDNKNINKKIHSDVKPFEIISLASNIQKEFKAKMFDSGEFWNTKYNKEFSYKNSAYDSLLDSLEIARTKLIKNNSSSLINSLLIKSMLLKYLEEKDVFEENYWKSKFLKNAKSFREVCDNNEALIDLFDRLSSHFNGGIFKLNDTDKIELLSADLTEFKDFLQPNLDDSKQLRFWDLYSFKDLPIELISNIYELFLKKEDNKGVVYTPSILVNFMIDEMMPLTEPKINFKVIDPSCGSGIFLVGAYKRLIQWWQINNDWKTPTASVLKSLIRNNIFGIDEKGEAVEVAKFSLSLALCEILAPKVIWNTLKFDNLSDRGNLIESDFFQVLYDKDNYHNIKNFDLVIGNPPFMSNKIISTQIEEIERKENQNIINRPKLPDDNLAYLFLEQSFKLLKNNAHICMVQPSGFLYNNKVESFRKYIFNTYNTKQIIDFTGLNNTLFKSKGSTTNVATAVIFMENKKPKINDSEVLHITVRQTFETREKIFFDLSYYDFHWLRYRDILENKYIWKCNLVGGSRVVNIIDRLNQYPTLKTYLENKKDNNQWIYSEGYSLGNKKINTPWLHNHLALLPKANPLDENGIDWDKTYNIQEKSFEAPRTKELFKAPLIVIREVFNKKTILLDYSDKDIAFTNRYIGISASVKYRNDLKDIVHNLKFYSKEYIFHMISTSSQLGIGMATALLKKNIDMLPYPLKKNNDFKLSKIEQYFADDTINYMFDWINGKTNLDILNNVNNNQIEEYQEVYCELLNSVYKEFKPLKTIQTEQFIISSFYYKDKPNEYLIEDNKLTDDDLEIIINNKCDESVMIKRVFKLYDKKVIYIIKPKQLRFWLKSIAVRDADDTFADLIDMRY